ncbi:MAG: phosphotransferase family protein [Anaerolineales bacterium]
MPASIAQYENRIRAIAPEANLAEARFNGEGLVNDLVICGDRVFRFAKNERSAQIMQNELAILDRVRPGLSVPIPSADHRGPDVMTYRLIAGEPLRNEFVRGLSVTAQERLAGQLGRCLRELHTTPVDGLPPTRAPVTHAAQSEIRREAEQLIYPLLMSHQRAWAERFFDAMLGDPRNFDYEPRLIHGDLWAEHLLVDSQAALCGVIDFGMAGVGDPANDIACLLQTYGESFVSRMQPAYPELHQYMQRARYYARVIEFEWAIRGLSENESFWFTAHLGNARDF